jgi:hypothetical protein
MTIIDLEQRQAREQQLAQVAQIVQDLIEPASPEVVSVSAVMADMGKIKALAILLQMSVVDAVAALQYAVWIRKTIADEGTVRESFQRLAALLAQEAP